MNRDQKSTIFPGIRETSLSLILRIVAASLAVLVTFELYLAINTKGRFWFRESRCFLNYDMLAESILAGRLHLKTQVHPERLAAKDPLNPLLEAPHIVDAIIWNGKYYFTQDPFPAVLHALVRILTGGPCRTGAMVTIFALGTLLALGLILLSVRQRFFPESPFWLLLYTFLSFAFSGPQMYMVSRPVVYHEAIVVGVFFTVLGTACFVHQVAYDSKVWKLFVAGIFFGAGFASRITLVVYALTSWLCLFYQSVRTKEAAREIVRKSMYSCVPIAFVVAAMMAHNYLRFGDIFDFGRTHIVFPATEHHLYDYIVLKDYSFRLMHIPYNIYHYLFGLPSLCWNAPFLVYPNYAVTYDGDVKMAVEVVGSILLVVPVFAAVIPLLRLRRYTSDNTRLQCILLHCGVGSALSFGLLSSYYRAVSRYLYEFTPLLFVILFVSLSAMWARSERFPGGQRTLKAVLAILFIANLLSGFILGINGAGQYNG